MTDSHAINRAALLPLRAAQYDWDEVNLRQALNLVVADDAVFHLGHPFGDMDGPEAFYDKALTPLKAAWPDVERRDWLVIGGEDEYGASWIGCAGHFVGTFMAPLLDIPSTGHLAHMRFHEFYRFEEGRVIEYQSVWDLPEVMMQASAWPMVPSLGREICVPGPSSGDGLFLQVRNPKQSRKSRQLIIDMLAKMSLHPGQGGPEIMELERFWHPKMNWYGPAGIGTARGVDGFRNWHQIPFLNAMPDRGKRAGEVTCHFFAENNYVGVTGWPNMIQTLTNGGWLGLPPLDHRVNLRSLDFWRVENGLIRENWVMLDLLHFYDQIGVDVLARMREFNKARVEGTVSYKETVQ